MLRPGRSSAYAKISVAAALTLFAAAYVVRGAAMGGEGRPARNVSKVRFNGEPLTIVSLKALNKTIRLGEDFAAADGWLGGVTAEVRNTSGKPITYFEVWFDLPETKQTGNMMAFPLRYGRQPWAHPSTGEAQTLEPGETVGVGFSPAEYGSLERLVGRRQPIGSINTVSLRISFVAFADGTAWDAGSLVRPDPANPRRYIRLE